MRIELQKPGEEVDENKQGVVKKAGAATSDEVSAHGAHVDFSCPNCGAALTGYMESNPQWFRCPDCSFWIHVYV
jgi:predicted RNA-binding Zn-ribbon protein involved in translation (DUF1610 family)